jgi:rhodanese-related sulfurtransferase
MSFLEKLFGLGPKVDYKSLVAEQGAKIIDVRTPQEFNSGNVPGSINIPLNQISHKINKLKSIKKPLVLCCASGNRSGQAKSMLEREGIQDVYNGGGWRKLL